MINSLDNTSYLVYGWMRNVLNLKGNELMIYAIIYGFSQDGESRFTGSLKTLMQLTGCTSKQTIMSCLKSLESKGLIEKFTIEVNRVKFCEYKSIYIFEKEN